MNERKGTFIVIEGTDGSGKATQFELLRDQLVAEGYDVATFDFPQYDEPSSFFVREYLNGKYGSINDVGPYSGSLFYALDRYHAATKIKKALSEGKIVIANRFTGSNMAHQGTKFKHPEERRGFFIWLDNLEFQMLGIPRPDKSFILRVPATLAQQLVDNKKERSYTNKKRDLHEADIHHLQLSVEVYDDLCELFPKDFSRIDCVRNNTLLDVQTIHQIIRETIDPLLPVVSKDSSGKLTKEKLEQNPYIEKSEQGFSITKSGKEFLNKAITNNKGNVYVFTGEGVNSVTTAAAMARLSRRGDDMRVILLDEFADKNNTDTQLLRRVITEYGDDSVQQLVGSHIVVEDASNLLSKKLEWGRLAAYLEQSTRYIYYDRKDKTGKYKYFTPSQFSENMSRSYQQKINKIFTLYSKMVHELTEYIRASSSTTQKNRDIAWKSATRAQACDAVRATLPVATTSTVGIFASGQALDSLIMHLQSDELLEARETGEEILREARKVLPVFLERTDKPDRGGAIVAYRSNTRSAVEKVTNRYLTGNLAPMADAVSLTDYWPKNELDLVPEIMYEFTDLSINDIRSQVDTWNFEKKCEVLQTYIGERLNRRHLPGRAIEKAHYSWDIICDYGIFRDLQRHRMVDGLEWQLLTPRYGYDVPQIITEAGLDGEFEQCFDISLELYSKLQSAGYTLEAQYATLLGHKMRWKITYNAREAFHFHELRTSPQGHPSYRKLVQQMHEKLCEKHPIIGEGMKFVNQNEDEALTRLAAERYKQFKLSQIDRKNQ